MFESLDGAYFLDPLHRFPGFHGVLPHLLVADVAVDILLEGQLVAPLVIFSLLVPRKNIALEARGNQAHFLFLLVVTLLVPHDAKFFDFLIVGVFLFHQVPLNRAQFVVVGVVVEG